jgi:hypothetical protein
MKVKMRWKRFGCEMMTKVVEDRTLEEVIGCGDGCGGDDDDDDVPQGYVTLT